MKAIKSKTAPQKEDYSKKIYEELVNIRKILQSSGNIYELKTDVPKITSTETTDELPTFKDGTGESIKTKEEVIHPIPKEYRELVNAILNQKFGINVEYDKVGNGFSYTIVVPDEYSKMTPAEKEMSGVDLRTRFVNYSEGINGVREWTSKVYNSLTPEIKSIVVSERT